MRDILLVVWEALKLVGRCILPVVQVFVVNFILFMAVGFALNVSAGAIAHVISFDPLIQIPIPPPFVWAAGAAAVALIIRIIKQLYLPKHYITGEIQSAENQKASEVPETMLPIRIIKIIEFLINMIIYIAIIKLFFVFGHIYMV